MRHATNTDTVRTRNPIIPQNLAKTPKDQTIRERFNTYSFADHKEKVIDLLKRVTRVSVETMEIVDSMQREKRS
jgi:predicted helicase